MRIDVITLFPSMVDAPLSESIVGRARRSGILELGYVNPRDFTQDRHRTVDDRPYGGGPGMVMMAEPLYQALRTVKKRGTLTVMLSPHGQTLTQELALELSRRKHIVLVCGHYEGVDERFVSLTDMQISVGDYILTGGELPAALLVDCVTRLLPGVLKKEEAPVLESFTDGLLEAPQYTRPSVWKRKKVPPVLLGGNHKEIEAWRKEQALALTKKHRPDLIKLEDK